VIDQQRIILWVTVALTALCLLGNEASRSLFGQYRERHRLQSNLINLRLEHSRLNREVTLIQQDPSYTEYLIRMKLGYVKKGEVEYRLLKKETH
jgi:cell division protein FtsB